MSHAAPDASARVRHKMGRWKLHSDQPIMNMPGELTPAWTCTRALSNLRRLHHIVTPRVSAACWGTLWNRWTTARRFQQRQSAKNRCVFSCSPRAEDSIEHYAFCPHIWQRLRLPSNLCNGLRASCVWIEALLMKIARSSSLCCMQYTQPRIR